MNITAQDKLRAQIEAAFADTPAPGDDDDDISRTANDEGIADYFRFTTWHGHNAYALSYHDVALAFFTDKAFRYWLPAFMLAELETPEGVPDIVEKLGYALAWPSRLPALAPDELEALAAFLHECVRKYSAPDGTCDADLLAAERAVQARMQEVQSATATEPSFTLPLRASVIVSRAAALEPFAAHLRTAERHVYNELVQLGAQVRWAESHAVSVRFTHRHRASHDDLLSLQQLRHLRSIDFYGTPVDVAVLRSLATLPALESLILCAAPIDDEAMAAIRPHKTLRHLDLTNTAVSDNASDSLRGLTALRSLRVAGTRISATTIQNLLEDHPWETLWLDGEQASPGCMMALTASACLEDLTLVGPRVTDETIAPLAACSSSLRRLALRQSLVTDSGLSALMALPALADLTLSGSSGITDAALGSLKQFQALKRLLVDDTGITDEGIAALTKALPNVDVWPSPWWLSLRTRYTLPLPEQIAESKLRAKIEGKP